MRIGGSSAPTLRYNVPASARPTSSAVSSPRPTSISFAGFGECLPYEDNVVEVDPEHRRRLRHPRRIRLRISPHENERAMMTDMAAAAGEMLDAIGARNIRLRQETRGQAHELGAARMGIDPKQFVLNPFLQTHDIRNLFVMDGSSFRSIGWQNPTLTIMALAVRSTDYLLEQLRQGLL